MSMDQQRHPNARKPLGHTAQIMLKLHPDLLEFVKNEADNRYESQAQFIRTLIIAEKRRVEMGKETE